MKFSIVTISYNQGMFLERAIRSVLDQDGVDVEYIVVDPGSTDGSRDIIQRYRDRIAHVIFNKDEGPADGLNRGFARASGDWFGYINSDDYYLLNGLQYSAIAAQCFPQAGAIVGNGYIVDQNGSIIRRSISTRFSLSGALHGACFSLQQATFYNAQAFREVGGFNTRNQTCWDGEILIDMASRGLKVRRFDADVGAFRIYEHSITGSGRLNYQYRDDSEAIFHKIKGRERNSIDRAIRGPLLRLTARLSDPSRIYRLAKDRF